MQQVRQTRPRNPSRARAGGPRYVYAVVADAAERTFDFAGIGGQPVYTIARDSVAAVASDIDEKRIRPERRHLAAHSAVLGKLLEHEHAVLPMRFGLIAAAPGEVMRLLARNHDVLIGQLRRIAGRVEMGLRVCWDVPNIFEYFVNTHPELKEMRDGLFRGPGVPSHGDRIELGRLFEQLLNEERLAYTHTVEQALSGRCAEIKRNALRDERELMNLACLIEKERQREFENSVFEAAQRFDNNFAFDYNGPWAPHTFAEVNLRSQADAGD
jgi:Gas vesicle synthesis protein GvpL/GvpF